MVIGNDVGLIIRLLMRFECQTFIIQSFPSLDLCLFGSLIIS